MEVSNPKKNKVLVSMWFESRKQFEDLQDAISGSDCKKVMNILFKVLSDEANKNIK